MSSVIQVRILRFSSTNNNFIDTDSLCLVMTDDMDSIVKPELKNEWERAKQQWFVLDETDASQTRRPGLLKTEWKTNNGAIVW